MNRMPKFMLIRGCGIGNGIHMIRVVLGLGLGRWRIAVGRRLVVVLVL
jgi:hypothetical protein